MVFPVASCNPGVCGLERARDPVVDLCNDVVVEAPIDLAIEFPWTDPERGRVS